MYLKVVNYFKIFSKSTRSSHGKRLKKNELKQRCITYDTITWLNVLNTDVRFSDYFSISIDSPTLCPPWLKFFPSISVERVRTTPSMTFCWYPRPI